MHPVQLDLRLDMIRILSTVFDSSQQNSDEVSSSNFIDLIRSFECHIHIDKLLVID